MENAWLQRAVKFYLFLTPRVSAFFGLRVLTGVFLFVAEISLAYFLFSFFQRIQGIELAASLSFAWLDSLPYGPFLFCFCGTILFKGVLEWADISLQRCSEEYYRETQRLRLVQWLFHTRYLDQEKFLSMFTQKLDQSVAAMTNLQVMAKQLALILPLLGALFYISWMMTLALTMVLMAMVLPLRFTNRSVRKYSGSFQEHSRYVHGRLLMSVKNLLLFRIHDMAETEMKQVEGGLQGMRRAGVQYGFATATSGSYVFFLGTILVVVIGGVSRKVSPEVSALIIPYLYILNRFLTQTLSFINQVPSLRYHSVSLAAQSRWWAEHAHDGVRGRDLYLRKTNPCLGEISQPLGWRVSGMSFKFADRPTAIFDNLSLTLPAGQVTVLVGESGSGKSTLLYLLLGELSPDAGKIEVTHAGRSALITECRHEILSRVGYVGAESFLIGGTLRENLTYGSKRPVTDEQIRAAAIKAHCQFIYEHPNGLEHRLTDQGEGLSAGQKQRLCLARALLREPKVLILDEATANLDEATENALVDTLMNLKGQMTMICATHRKGFLRLADNVVELKTQVPLRVVKTA